MTGRARAILSQALELNPEDRVELVGALTASLETWSGDEVEEAWKHEAAERLASLKAGTLGSQPWTTVRSRLAAKLS